MQLADVWEKIANNARLTPEEILFLRRSATETQQRNSFVSGITSPDSKIDIQFPTFSIYSEILQANRTSITVPIPSNANHLLIMGSVRTTRAAYNDGFIGRFNSDSGANYREIYDGAQSTTQLAGQTAGQTFFGISVTTGASATAGSFGGFFLFAPHVRSATWKQTIRLSGTSEYSATDMLNLASSCHWQNTSPIQTVTFLSENGADILAGSLISVHGIQ
jgi:hypothetical protein